MSDIDNIPTQTLVELLAEHMNFVADALQYDDRTDMDQLRIIVKKGRRLKAKTETILKAS